MEESNFRYAVYISGVGTNIKKVINKNSDLSRKIKLIISDNKENNIVKELCKQNNIIYIEFEFKGIKKNKSIAFSDYLLDELEKNDIDYCFSFGTCILKGNILEKYKYKIINFHPSILPHFPGLKAIDKAIESNVNIIGNTAHFIDENIDTGPIILQNVVHKEMFLKNGYDAVLEGQVVLMEKIDRLLSEDRIHIVEEKVKIDNANYFVSNIYPEV